MNRTKSLRKEIYANESASGWQETEERLRTNVYADGDQWRRFLNLLLPALGVALMVSGILFFFAYNWMELDKFIKLGLIEGLLVTAVALVLFTRWSLPVKQIILTGASFLVGALFAVYGQIYQTGANAYDFFLGWTAFVTIWTLASGYLPLWLLWIGLVNVTIYLYKDQMMFQNELPAFLLKNAHTLVCAVAVVLAEWLHSSGRTRQRTAWFINTVALAAIANVTANAMVSILSGYPYFSLILVMLLLVFGGGLFYGFRKRQLFYIATIPFCMLLILAALLVQALEEYFNAGLILFLGLMFVAGTTGLIFYLIKLKKQWHGTTE